MRDSDAKNNPSPNIKADLEMDLSSLDLPEKEEKILKSAIAIFSHKGFHAATTKEIAVGAGVAEGTVFKYFKTKKGILRNIVIRLIDLAGESLLLRNIEKIFEKSDTKPVRDIMKELILDRYRLARRIYPMARVVFTEAILHEDVRQAVINSLVTPAGEIFSHFYRKMADRGEFRTDIDPGIILRSIVGNIMSFVAYRLFLGENLPKDISEEELDMLIEVILNGISAQEKGGEQE
jgi:AcrR family transcriptional regulator